MGELKNQPLNNWKSLRAWAQVFGKVVLFCAPIGLLMIFGSVYLPRVLHKPVDSAAGFDYITIGMIGACLSIYPVYFLLCALPGAIAKSRNCTHESAINFLGYAGGIFPPFLPIALVWSFLDKKKSYSSARLF